MPSEGSGMSRDWEVTGDGDSGAGLKGTDWNGHRSAGQAELVAGSGAAVVSLRIRSTNAKSGNVLPPLVQNAQRCRRLRNVVVWI